jgi:L-2,4-diaminobutyrate transaminase
MHGFTYSGHPVGCAVALANIDIIERENLVEKAAENGHYMLELLCDRVGGHPFVGDVRGAGLMLAIEFVTDKLNRRPFAEGSNPHRLVAKCAMRRGVLTRALPFIEVNSFSPPLSITKAEIEEGVERYAAALEDALPLLRETAA